MGEGKWTCDYIRTVSRYTDTHTHTHQSVSLGSRYIMTESLKKKKSYSCAVCQREAGHSSVRARAFSFPEGSSSKKMAAAAAAADANK